MDDSSLLGLLECGRSMMARPAGSQTAQNGGDVDSDS